MRKQPNLHTFNYNACQWLDYLEQAIPFSVSGMTIALDQLTHLVLDHPLSEVVNKIPIGGSISKFHAILEKLDFRIPPLLRLQFYQLFSNFSDALLKQGSLVSHRQKNEWLLQINNALEKLHGDVDMLQAHPDNYIDRETAPYLHHYIYHLQSARTAIESLYDGHSSCCAMGSSTQSWHNKIDTLVTHRSQILQSADFTSTPKQAVLQTQKILTEEYNKSCFQSPDWKVIYACIETLEAALLKIPDDQIDWKNIIFGCADPTEETGNQLIGLAVLHDYRPVFGGPDRWCVRARMTQLASAMRDAPNAELSVWGNDTIAAFTEMLKNTKSVGGNVKKGLLMLTQPMETWEAFVTTQVRCSDPIELMPTPNTKQLRSDTIARHAATTDLFAASLRAYAKQTAAVAVTVSNDYPAPAAGDGAPAAGDGARAAGDGARAAATM